MKSGVQLKIPQNSGRQEYKLICQWVQNNGVDDDDTDKNLNLSTNPSKLGFSCPYINLNNDLFIESCKC